MVLSVHFQEAAFQRNGRRRAVSRGDGRGSSPENGNERTVMVEHGYLAARGGNIERPYLSFELFPLEGRDGETHGEFTVYR